MCACYELLELSTEASLTALSNLTFIQFETAVVAVNHANDLMLELVKI